MTNDVDTLATALYATTDDMLKEHSDLAPWRPPVGITPRPSDAELVTIATMQAILGYTSEAKWLRHARAHLCHLFPYLPQQPGHNKRLRKAAGLMRSVNRILATTTGVERRRVVDSTTSAVVSNANCPSMESSCCGLSVKVTGMAWRSPVQASATGHRIDQRDLQGTV